ncbi:ABC transporter permease [Bacillus carboniphilus]|uniref:ABC transporter permease n=1 Tax=Bacillus carboniphilus TaxID=86663 RepID=A0ABY9JP11_9BACI|nr:ABC transporter permease [Bacillus carboniphilus]WLR41154.1 ABC transporter permease [Bacillus carboniphilus]
MIGMRLASNRIYLSFHQQWKSWKSVIDWMYIVYFGMPLLFFLWITYKGWLDTSVSSFTFQSIWFGIGWFLLAYLNAIHFHIKEADAHYLFQKKKIYSQMRNTVFFYQLFLIGLKWIGVGMIIWPLLFDQIPLITYTVYIVYGMILNSLIMLSDYVLFNQKWKKALLFFGYLVGHLYLWLIFNALQTVIVLCLLIGVCWFLHKDVIYTVKRFQQDVILSHNKKAKFTSLIFSLHNMNIEKTVELPTIKKPKETIKLWKRSKRIYKKRTSKNGFKELFFKRFIRGEMVKVLLPFISIMTIAIFQLSTPLKVALLFAAGFGLYFWCRGVFDHLHNHDSIKRLTNQSNEYLVARHQASRIIMVLTMSFIGIFVLVLVLIRRILIQ